MQQAELNQLAEDFLAAWNSQEVDRVLDCYTPGVQYRDPNVQLEGADALRPYLAKLFAVWQMHWILREAYPLAETDGAAVLWRAQMSRAGRDERVEIDGMDLVLLVGGKISRNDVYFDRSLLGGLPQARAR